MSLRQTTNKRFTTFTDNLNIKQISFFPFALSLSDPRVSHVHQNICEDIFIHISVYTYK